MNVGGQIGNAGQEGLDSQSFPKRVGLKRMHSRTSRPRRLSAITAGTTIRTPACLALLVLGWTGIANAQEEAVGSGFGLGTQLGQYQDDFGLGLNVNSPSFADDRIAVRLRVNFMFHEHVQDRETTWTPYTSFSLGVTSVAGNVGEHIRLYGEGGVVGLLPSEEFSSDDFVFGGYGLFGFEFFMEYSQPGGLLAVWADGAAAGGS